MKKNLIYLVLSFLTCHIGAQNPGLVISEVLANPNGTDSCKEYVELLAVQNINFSLTPYTVIFTNNGAATANGWINGGALTYAFAINSGSVSAGSVVYVGGNCMSPTGAQLRAINVKYQNGDGGIGLAASGGVLGNGGANCDGVAVFNLPVSSITSSTIPTDALFFGTGVGTASVSAVDGYELPVNDYYSGGKLNGTSFIAPDPGADLILTSSGVYNLATNSWSVTRGISTGTTVTDGVSTVSLITTGTVAPSTISFVSNDTTVVENTASANIFIKLTGSSSNTSAISVYATALSNASSSDYTLGSTTFTFAANAPVNTAIPITFSLNNDVNIESAEYIILRFYNPQNANIGSINQCVFYIADNDKVVPAPSNAITLNLLSSFSNSISGSNSAEIVAHDPTTQRLYIANSIGGKLDIVNFVNPSSPALLFSVPITTYGNINSVAVRNGLVAMAIENGPNPQDSGRVVFFDKDGIFLKQVKVGMMPDMITFNQAGTKVLTANEGEPNQAYTNDPDGSVSIIDISGGIAAVTQTNVSHVTFTVYNGQEALLRSQGIRIYGLAASTAKDFEPEYISISKDDSKAWVTLQENNAIVEINLSTNAINYVKSLGTKNHALLNNGLDASNLTKGINVSNFPIKGMYMPDAIASYTVAGVNYLITANEGDSRAYTGFTEEQRIGSVNLDALKFPFANQMKNNSFLGRLNVTDKSGDIDNDGDLDTLYSYGSRSFSIWNAVTGQLVYDSKDDMELITATNSFSVLFNASNSNNTRKDRSDDKGPEPEGVTVGNIGGNTYAFIALERIGGVMVYDVTNPNAPVYVTYVNNRSLPSGGPDRGAEGIIFIPQSQSPNGQHIVVAANEVSSTLSIWGIAGCTIPISSSVSVSGTSINACSNTPPVLTVPSATNLTYQWSNNGVIIPGAVSNTFAANNSGNYSVAINGGSNCVTGSLTQSISIIPSPTLLVAGSTSICFNSSASQTVTGAASYSWSSGATGSVVSLSPTITTSYSVTGTGTNGCLSNFIQTITVNSLPSLTITPANTSVCVGSSTSIQISGANTYTWSNGNQTSILSVSPLITTVYSVTGTNASSCSASRTATIVVNQLPVLTIAGNSSVCLGGSISQTVSGANTYTWNTGSNLPVITLTPNITGTFSAVGTDGNGCSSSTIKNIIVSPLPTISIVSTKTAICLGETLVLNANGASSYSWITSSVSQSIAVSPTLTSIYSVTGTDALGCSSSGAYSLNVSLCASLEKFNVISEYNLYPNPSNNEFYIDAGDSKVFDVKIINTIGQVVYYRENHESGLPIDIANINKGVYHIQISTSTKIKKLIIE